MRLRAVIAGVVALWGARAAAHDVQPWPDVYVSAPIAKGWPVSAEVVGRIADDTRTSQVETRLEFGHALSPHVTAWIGWVHVASYNPRALNGRENQLLGQVDWSIGELGRLRLSTRARFELRDINRTSETSWRWRQQARFSLPIGASSRAPRAVAWVETFVALNRTGAQAHTLDQLRTFAGVSVPLARGLDVEFGYLNQRLYRRGVTLVNDTVPLVLSARF